VAKNMKAFVIRLKDIEPSETLSKECIESGKIFGLDIDPFDGIYGEENIKSKTEHFNIRPFSEGMKKGRLGVKGCFLSHYSLWLKCLEINEPILICEHDAMIISPLPNNIEDSFNEFLILDPFNKFSKSYVDSHKHSHTLPQKIIEYTNIESRKKYGVTSEYAMGLQAYVIKPSAVKKLQEKIKINGYLPADMQCNKETIYLETVTSSVASINKKFYNNVAEMQNQSTTQKKWDQHGES
jgi:GR25 family glycosyltransferase involved in LPS biosynthesis